MDTPKLKDLPFAPTKGEIYTMYSYLPEKTVRMRLNSMIKDFCKRIGETFNPRIKIVDRPVWIEFVQTYGVPKGYKDNQDIFNKQGLV